MRILLVFMAFMLLTSNAWSAGAKYQADGILVKVKNQLTDVFIQDQKDLGIKIKRKLKIKDQSIFVIENVNGDRSKFSQTQVINKLKNRDYVEIAEPNYIVTIITPMIGQDRSPQGKESLVAPNDPMFSKLWGLNNLGYLTEERLRGVPGADISALKAWDITKGSKQVKIAIIDTGIDYAHPDLKDNIWTNDAELNGQPGVDDDGNGFIDDIHGYDFANGDANPMDDNKHGTHCAGTIGAVHDNNTGVAGVMGEVSMMPVKFLTGSGSGSLDHAIESIDYATKMGVDIMSNSWGGGGFSQLLEDSIKRAQDAGIVFVAAAGNSSDNNDQVPSYPASYPLENVISVAAYNIDDNLANFSCYGKKTVHVAAPGQDIFSTTPNNSYASLSGTSMATPHISGVLGLLIAKEGRKNFTELKNRLMYSSTPADAYRSKVVAQGRVNAYNFLKNIITITPPVIPVNWTEMPLDTVFESEHPYLASQSLSKTVTIPGAKYIRVLVEKYDLENKYDNLIIKNKKGEEVERLTGEGANYKTEFVEGDSITIEFKSDYSVQKWGYVIRAVEYATN